MTVAVPKTRTRDRVTKCGFCLTGHHDRCKPAIRAESGRLWRCGCTDPMHEGQPVSCVRCRVSDEGVNPDTWQCRDLTDCDDRVQARRQSSDFYRTVMQPLLERKQEHDAVVAQARREHLDRIRPKVPRKRKSAGSKGDGLCQCGCGGTTKARFMPGHDARHASALVRRIREGDQAARDEIEQRGWGKKLPADLRG